jgi:TM2 domain-containing membrane protein YozV
MSEESTPKPPQQGAPTGQPDARPPAPGQQYTQAQQGQMPPQQQYAPQQQYSQQQGYQYPSAQPQPQQGSSRTQGIGSPQKDKWVAAVLAFVLGAFGIHKFYLGYKTEGIIMIIVSIAGSICLGLGPLVMVIISLIEAVRYVILTQADFERTYVYGSKGWL